MAPDDLVLQRANGDRLSLRFSSQGSLSSAFLTVGNAKPVDVTAQIPGIRSPAEALGRLRMFGFNQSKAGKDESRIIVMLQSIAAEAKLCVESCIKYNEHSWQVSLISESDLGKVAPPLAMTLLYSPRTDGIYITNACDAMATDQFLRSWSRSRGLV